VRDEYSKYMQPDIRIGRQARCYPTADTSYGGSTLGWVTKNHNNTINMTLMGEGYAGTNIAEIPHISDPRLKLNSEWRANGAWDYAEEEDDPQIMLAKTLGDLKRLTDRLARLDKRVEEAEKVAGEHES